MDEHCYDVPPENAWLLVGDSASLPSAAFLEEIRDAWPQQTLTWTAAKTTRFGDLVLIYFIAPQKAVRFVARADSDAYWSNQIPVNAHCQVADEQWWVELSPLVEIEPIPYGDLQKASGGYLNLKGRSGRYLSPLTLAKLEIRPLRRSDQAAIDKVLEAPTGLSELPEAESMTFDEWTGIASGALTLEANVSEYVVEPLLRFILEGTTNTWVREYRVKSGHVDFVIVNSNAEPLAAVEVKLRARKHNGGSWGDSPDFKQLRRYMDDLQVPGLLIDAQNIYFVGTGADEPDAEIARCGDPAIVAINMRASLFRAPYQRDWKGEELPLFDMRMLWKIQGEEPEEKSWQLVEGQVQSNLRVIGTLTTCHGKVVGGDRPGLEATFGVAPPLLPHLDVSDIHLNSKIQVREATGTFPRDSYIDVRTWLHEKGVSDTEVVEAGQQHQNEGLRRPRRKARRARKEDGPGR